MMYRDKRSQRNAGEGEAHPTLGGYMVIIPLVNFYNIFRFSKNNNISIVK